MSESKEQWLTARVSHMLACTQTRAELIDEAVADDSPHRQGMARAAMDIYMNTSPASPIHQRALGRIAAILEQMAMTRAQGEWNRQQAESLDALPEAA